MRAACLTLLLFVPIRAWASGTLQLSELLPNPPPGQKEWIEIQNNSSSPMSLAGWKLEDQSGNLFILPDGIVGSGEYFLIYPSKSRLSLNNDGDTISLLDATDKSVDSIHYSTAPRGSSYARVQNQWWWTTMTTPDAQNKNAPTLQIKAQSNATASIAPKKNAVVQLTGVVTAAPGSVGARTMYLTNVASAQDLPKNIRVEVPLLKTTIQIGSSVAASGKLRTSGGEPYISVGAADDINVGTTERPPEPIDFTQLDPARDAGALTKVSGHVVRRTSNGFTLATDDGNDIHVELPPNVSKPGPVGVAVTVVGIYAPSRSDDHLLVRQSDDLSVEPPATTNPPTKQDPPATKPPSLLIGALSVAGMALGVAVWWWFRRPRKLTPEELPYELIDDEDDV